MSITKSIKKTLQYHGDFDKNNLKSVYISDEMTNLFIGKYGDTSKIAGDLDVTGNIKGNTIDVNFDEIICNDIICDSIVVGGDITLGDDDKIIFGDAGEYIVGDGTDLDIASSRNINLTSSSSGATINIDPGDNGLINLSGQYIALPATSVLYFDGGTHTAIDQESSDLLRFRVGGDEMLLLDEASDKITMAATNWVAGTVSASTITEFSATNSSYAGMILGYTRLQGDFPDQSNFEIQNSITVEDDTHQITFKTPPSELVEIEAIFAIDRRSTDTKITVGLSDQSATEGYNSIGVEYEYDGSVGIGMSDDEVDDEIVVVKWVLSAAELAAIGSSNTFYIGFGTGGASKLAYLVYGVRATHSICDHPFIIKATALPAAIYDGT